MSRMKNRDRYILKQNEYDMLIKIQSTMWAEGLCVIDALTGEYQYGEKKERCLASIDCNCESCIQKWLNEES